MSFLELAKNTVDAQQFEYSETRFPGADCLRARLHHIASKKLKPSKIYAKPSAESYVGGSLSL
jgi:hypothetical protein